MKINEYVTQIKNKPIKIEIKPAYISKSKNKKNSKQLAKSRSLLIRAYLVKLGISHNRIKILLEDTDSSVSINEVTINFIELWYGCFKKIRSKNDTFPCNNIYILCL